MAKYYGKNIVGELPLSDAQTLPDSTDDDSTNMVYVGNPTNGQLWINVYANTAITIATGAVFNIELESYSDGDTPASAIAPFTKDNAHGEIANGDGTAETDAHIYLLHKTSADTELAFSAGDLITQCAIPEDMLNAIGHTYVQLKYETDADESSEKVDAFVWVKA